MIRHVLGCCLLCASITANTALASALDRCFANADVRMAVQACLAQEGRAAQGNLDRVEGMLAAELAALRSSAMGTAALSAFIAVTSAFAAYRVRHCRFLAMQAMPGSGAGDIEQGCLADLAAQRTSELSVGNGNYPDWRGALRSTAERRQLNLAMAGN